MKSLVVYHSRTGNTKTVAERIANHLGAEIEEIQEANRRGGNVRAAFDAILRRSQEILPMHRSPEDFDLLLVGTPVWARGPTPAVQSFLSSVNLNGKPVALFCTMGGMGDARTFDQMKKLLQGARIVGRLSLGQTQLRDEKAMDGQVEAWIHQLQAKTAPETDATA